MRLTGKKLTAFSRDFLQVKNLYKASFSKTDRFPFHLMCLMTLIKGVDFTAWHYGRELCAMTYTIESKDSFYILYLAVSPEARGKGIGTSIIEEIKQSRKDKTIFLDIDFPSEDKADYAERIRRLHFYERNGFTDTGFTVSDHGEDYMILSCSKDFKPEQYEKIFRKIFYTVRVNERT